MAGVFRRPFHPVRPRRIVHGVAGAVNVPAPGLRRRQALLREAADRLLKKLLAIPLYGVRRPGFVVPVAKMLMERHRKIMRARLARERVIPVPTFPPVVGATVFPSRALVQRLPVMAARANLPLTVHGRTEGSTPFTPRPSVGRPAPVPVTRANLPIAVHGRTEGATPVSARPSVGRPAPVPARAKPAAVATVLAPPVVVGPVPSVPKPTARVVPVVVQARPAAPVPTFSPAVAGSMPPARRPFRRPTLMVAISATRVHVFGPHAGVNSTPFVFRPAVRFIPVFRPARFLILPSVPAVTVIVVCTSGIWSSVVLFSPCDDFRITIDGPDADNIKISATIELQE